MNPPGAFKIGIACGGTGGHFFPGLAVAEQLRRRGCEVTLLVSPKDVDRQAVRNISGMEIVTLPAVGLGGGNKIAFLRGCWQSYRAARKHFRRHPPEAVLAMGGFTSAPPVLAAKHLGAKTFLHESNTIPGRANRWLSRIVNEAFIGFPQAADRLHARRITATGTPVRPEFQSRNVADCRVALGLDPTRDVLLVVGGSQGATGLNNLLIHSLPLLKADWQFLHFTGAADVERVRRAYVEKNLRAVVQPFFSDMAVALGASTAAVSRAGASSLAELAAMRVPAVLVPFPAAMDNHQFFNARAFEQTGAARLLEQANATPELLARTVSELMTQGSGRETMQAALAKWHSPGAAEEIAERILSAISRSARNPVSATLPETRGQGGPRSEETKRQSFSAA